MTPMHLYEREHHLQFLTAAVPEAAAAWRALGYPYERALALMTGDEDCQREAIEVLESLGAIRTAERVRERMRAAGVRSIPRGMRPSTLANPAGLTRRESEILALLAQGLSNSDLAVRLHRSVRTIEHHIATLIAKLGAESRHEAVRMARARGLLPD